MKQTIKYLLLLICIVWQQQGIGQSLIVNQTQNNQHICDGYDEVSFGLDTTSGASLDSIYTLNVSGSMTKITTFPQIVANDTCVSYVGWINTSTGVLLDTVQVCNTGCLSECSINAHLDISSHLVTTGIYNITHGGNIHACSGIIHSNSVTNPTWTSIVVDSGAIGNLNGGSHNRYLAMNGSEVNISNSAFDTIYVKNGGKLRLINCAFCVINAESGAHVTVNSSSHCTIRMAGNSHINSDDSSIFESFNNIFLFAGSIDSILFASPSVLQPIYFNRQYTCGSVTITTNLATNPCCINDIIIHDTITCQTVDTVRAEAVNGTAPYNYQWSADLSGGSLGANYAVVPVGTHSVTVSDAKGCQFVRNFTLQQNDIQVSLSSTDGHVCPGENERIDAIVTGGLGSYDYSWSNSPYNRSHTITNLASAIIVTVTDAMGCTATSSDTVTSSNPTVQIHGSAHRCVGDTIALWTTVGAMPPYTISWSNNANSDSILFATTNPSWSGGISVFVSDTFGCVGTNNHLIHTHHKPVVEIQSPGRNTFQCPETIIIPNVVAMGGNNYWVTPSDTFLGKTPQLQSETGDFILVSSNQGCVNSDTITINSYAKDSIVMMTSDSIACRNSSINLQANSILRAQSFLWETPQNGIMIGDSISVTGFGHYLLTGTDSMGCLLHDTLVIDSFPTPITTMQNGSIVCIGDSNGTASISSTGGTAPYTFAWSHGDSTSTISGLSAGTYTVTTTDNNGCSDIDSINIAEYSAAHYNINTERSCDNANTGRAWIYGTNGSLSYLWSTGETQSQITALASGRYTVTLTDGNGCTQLDSVQIQSYPTPTISLGSNHAYCGSATGALINNHTNQTGFNLFWYDSIGNYYGSANHGVINNVTPGKYYFEAHSNGCVYRDSVIVEDSLHIIPVNLVAITPSSCKGSNDGTVEINIGNLTSPIGGNIYWSWDGGNASAGPFNFNSSFPNGWLMYNLAPDSTIGVTVIDHNGCVGRLDSIIMTEPDSLILSPSLTTIQCHGGNGSIKMNATGGTGALTYVWNISSVGNIDSISGGSGSYSVYAYDEKHCYSASHMITLTEPSPIVSSLQSTPTLCHNDSTGSVSISTTGGTAPYAFAWSHAGSTNSMSGLSAGTYTVTTTDNNGCIDVDSVIVHNATMITTSLQSSSPLCHADSNGFITILANGGTGQYNYVWNVGQGSTITNLVAGTYTVTTTDTNSCFVIDTVVLDEPQPYNTTLSNHYSGCAGQGGGSSTIIVSGQNGSYTYAWSNGATNATATGLSNGSYSVTVEDILGCINIDSVYITEPDSLRYIISSSAHDSTANHAGNGWVTLIPSGGVDPYNITWSTGDTGMIMTNLLPGTYTATIADSNGCIQTVEVTLHDIAVITGVNTQANENSITMYPNPTSDWIYIETKEQGKISYQLFSINGRLLRQKTESNSIDMRELASGAYIIRVATTSQTQNFKVVKQ